MFTVGSTQLMSTVMMKEVSSRKVHLEFSVKTIFLQMRNLKTRQENDFKKEKKLINTKSRLSRAN